MNELQIIDQREVLGKDFKIYGDFDNPLFLAKDVAEWIDYDISSVNKMLATVDENEKTTRKIVPNGSNYQTEAWFLTEDGLYEVLMQSRKPIAKQFKAKIKEILRSVRKTGGYIPAAPEDSEAEIMAKAFIIANKTIEEQKVRLGQLQAVNSKLTTDNAIMQPKAEFFDELVDRNLLSSFRDTAKELKIKEKEFIQFLIDHKYVFRDKKGKLTPCAGYEGKGLFEVKETFNEKTNWSGLQTLITPKGRETFRLLMAGLKSA